MSGNKQDEQEDRDFLPDPRARNIIGRPDIRPCAICGEMPKWKTKQIGQIEISLLVYPCDCYDRLHREKEEKEQWEKRLKASKIPPRYYHARLAPSGLSTNEKVMIPWCKNYIDLYLSSTLPGVVLGGSPAGNGSGRKSGSLDAGSPCGSRGFGLIGDVGVGKTYYICAVLLDLLRKGRRCLFWSVPEYYKALKSSFSKKDSEEYDALIDETKNIEIMAFDDIGAEYGTQWTSDELADIINHRYNHLLATLWTSNLRINELTDRIGKRTVDRLREMGGLKLIEGKSIRGREKRE